MFKKVLAVAALAIATVSAQASTLYWQVSATEGQTFTVARLVVTGGSLSEPKFVDAAEASDLDVGTNVGTYVKPTWADISSYSGSSYSFYVELLTYASESDSEPKVYSANKDYPYSYDELLSKGYISSGSISTPTIVGTGAAMDGGAIPEPTSGMMLLMGGALLALRRKRA